MRLFASTIFEFQTPYTSLALTSGERGSLNEIGVVHDNSMCTMFETSFFNFYFLFFNKLFWETKRQKNI